MIRMLLCRQCKKPVTWGGKKPKKPMKIKWSVSHEFCQDCQQSKEINKTYEFCCEKCALAFLQKLVGHRCQWKQPHPQAKKRTGPRIRILETCSVCDQTRIRQGKKVLYKS